MRLLALLSVLVVKDNYVECQEKSKSFTMILVRGNSQEHIVKWIQELAISTDYKITNLHLDGEDNYNKICGSFSGGPQIIVDVCWSGNELVRRISSEMGVPYIHVDVSISPYLTLLEAYLDYKNSTDVSLIFDNHKYVDQSLYFWIDSTRLRMVMSDVLDKTTANRLKQMRPIPNNFVIVSSSQNMTRLFQISRSEDLIKLPERWNLLFLDFQNKNFNRDLLENQPISLLSIDEEICCKFLKTETCHCPPNFDLQKKFFETSILILSQVMEDLSKEELDFPTEYECNSTNLNGQIVDHFIKILDDRVNGEDKVYRDEKALRINYLGIIERGSNSSEIIATYENNSLTILYGKSIEPIKAFYRIGITHALPWSYKEADKDTGEIKWTGYCVDFTEKLSQMMNFEYEFVEPETGTFGDKRNGVWDGVIGDLASGNTDMAITAITMTADREEVVDFVAPYFEQTGITIVMRKPVRKTSLFKFMTVLKLEVWLSIIAALIITGIMIWFLDKYSPYSARNNKKAYPYPCREFTLKESFWFALTSFTPQGGGEAPKALSGRTLVAAYWLFVVLMLATFTANLAAFLTVERMQAPVQSLEQLARQSRINYTVVKDSETHTYFINMKFAEDTLYRMWKELTLNASTDDTRYRVWDYPIREQYGHILLAINDSDPVADAAEGFRIVDERLDADFAFIHDSSEVKYEISRNCNLTEVGEVFAEKPYTVAVQQGSHLQDELSKMILDLQKERFFEHLQAKYWNQSAKGDCPSTDDNEGITLESLGGVFIATLFGLALAMVTLAGEVIYYRKKRNNGENKKVVMKTVNPPRHPPELKPSKLIGLDYPTVGGVNIKTIHRPVPYENVRLSHINLYPRARNRITQVDN